MVESAEGTIVPTVKLPSQAVLEHELIYHLLRPPNAEFARDLSRELGRRMKRPVPLLLIADALRHLSASQRGSGPKERMFVLSALLQRVQREAEWITQPMAGPLPSLVERSSDTLANGTWLWKTHSLSVLTSGEARWGVLHLWLKNDLDVVDVGQPVSVVLADETQTYDWSPVASGRVPNGQCPEGCRGSLASVSVASQQEILGHLSFALPGDAAPDYWGIVEDDRAELRSCQPALGAEAAPKKRQPRARAKAD